MSKVKSVAVTQDKLLVQAFWIVTFSVVTAVAAIVGKIALPFTPIPLTLQTLFVLLAGAVLGKRNGAIAMFLYLVYGASGLPVFAGGAAGFAHLIGPTGGFLIAFPITAFLTGYLIEKKSGYFWTMLWMFVATIPVFIVGTIQLQAYGVDGNLLQAAIIPFIPGDILKVIAAATLYKGGMFFLKK